MRVDPYFAETVRIERESSLADICRAMAEAAEELEARGVTGDDLWRHDEDWQRVGRIRQLALRLESALGEVQSRDVGKWRALLLRRRSIRRVK